MSVYTRTGSDGKKTYWFRIYINGTEIRRSTKQADRKEALRQEATFRTAYMSGGIQAADPREAKKLSGFIPRFLDFCVKEKGIRESTRKTYVRHLRLLSESRALRNIPLGEIRSAEFAAYVEERMQSPEQQGKFTSLRRERQVLITLLRYAAEIGEIQSVPIIRSPGRGVQRRREFIPDQDMFRAYLAQATGYLRDAAILSASCGLRPGEIVSLRPSEVVAVEDGFVITLQQSKSEMGKKPIHVSVDNAKAACAVLASRIESDPLFPELSGEKETRVTTLSQAHTTLRRKLKMPEEFVFYSFRHLYVTTAGAGLNPQQLRELARHSDIKTTMIYFNPQETTRREIAKSVKLLETS